PYLKASRPSPTEVIIDYGSPRKMCHVAKGIARGLAAHFDERVEVGETECMLKGDARCLIRIRQT
ncbi:MAG TPA: 4-vinyl reductase, partial [Gemmatimonadaceae bacterium]|nr:4-vinyl reductase [Gemmatimonadaceae bacterium]